MNTYIKSQQFYMAWLLATLFLISGCSSFIGNSPRIESVEDGVAVSYAAIESGAEVTTDLLKEGLIETDEARFCQSLLERAFTLTQIAEREAIAGKPEGAEQILSTVSRLLGDLRKYLGREF